MDQTFCPKVSIVIPVYNGADYLKEAIDSALAQTYENLEVIVVNDGSCDEGATRAVAVSYGERIVYLEKENGGVSSALNHGIRHMTGDYFSWLSHDDKYEPGKVANAVSCLASFEQRDLLVAFCDSYYINERSESLRRAEVRLEKGVVHTGTDVLRHVLTHDMLNMCCLLIPRAAFEVCGYFDEDLRYNQDALMLYRLFGGGYSLVVEPDRWDVMYRLHAAQTSKTRRDLLLRDSFELAKIIAPLFARQSSKAVPLLRLFARRNAKHACRDAVLECVRVGRKTGVLRRWDVLYLRLWLWVGRGRNVLKRMRDRLVFHA